MALTLRRHVVWLLALVCGCAGTPTRVEWHAPAEPVRGIILVAEGAGRWHTASQSIASTAEAQQLPVYVRSFEWTHGRGRALADVVDYPYARCKGRRMAEEIAHYRRTCPNIPIYVVGYSAGSGVVLAAAESLPPDTLERVVLLAPSVSAGYDLRRALASARQGIDVFISERDTGYLGFGTGLVGTTDNKRDDAAGRVGFRTPTPCPGEAPLYSRLHQHPWTPQIEWTGNEGQHNGSLQPAYLKMFVMPLLTPAR